MRNVKWFVFFILSLCSDLIIAQGFNHVWLLGNSFAFAAQKARMSFDTSAYLLQTEFRKMPFEGTEATICDSNGIFLMSSNGVWIANANNDTMMNGAALNPGNFVNSFPNALVIDNGNIFLPFPDHTNQYYLIHQTGDSLNNVPSLELFYTLIDMTLDSGRGAVISKNNKIFSDTLSWGIAACKHANGRDWWIVAIKDSTDIIYKLLLTPNGIQSITSQHLNFTPKAFGNTTQLTFSQNGDKLITATYDNPVNKNCSIVISEFDRCTGVFSNTNTIQLSTGAYLWGLAFSPDGNFAYASNLSRIFQVNTNSFNIDTVAINDGFWFPIPPATTSFGNMYLAANGKIYLTSGGGTQHIHEMNFPDSAGLACDVQQHSIFLNIWNFRAVPNHPNYYLGRLIGSSCDTVWQGIQEQQHDFNFRIYPNPISNNNLSIGYLLPQSRGTSGAGVFQIYDITGKVVFKYNLPQWSNEQSFNLPDLSNGVYSCVITSNNFRVSKKLVVIRE